MYRIRLTCTAENLVTSSDNCKSKKTSRFFDLKKKQKDVFFYSLAFCYTRMSYRLYLNKVLRNFAAYCNCEHLGLSKMLKNTFMGRVGLFRSHTF